MGTSVDGRGERGKVAAAVSNAITTLHRDYYGRGAGRTRTLIGEDYVIVFLHDIYTAAERTLIDAGHFPQVNATRSAFQDTMRERFSTAVEEIVGRKVVGFLSQVTKNPDISLEAFILESANHGRAASSDGAGEEGDTATG